MQESGIDEEDATRHGADWYLSRDGEQIGPLTDRELSLFAEGGNFRPGDYLWTAGLDGWKPAEAIFATAASGGDSADADFPSDDEDGSQLDAEHLDAEHLDAEHLDAAHLDAARREAEHLEAEHLEAEHLDATHLDGDGTVDGRGEDVNAIVQALSGAAPPLDFKGRLMAELKTFAGAGAYLWAVFILLSLFGWLGDAAYGPGLGFFVLMTINGFFALQLMGLAARFGGLGDLDRKPPISAIVYETLAFGTLLFVLYLSELVVFGLVGGRGLGALDGLGGGVGTVALWIVLTVAMLPYFAFRVTGRAVGTETVVKFLTGRN